MRQRLLKAQQWRNELDKELGITYKEKVLVVQ